MRFSHLSERMRKANPIRTVGAFLIVLTASTFNSALAAKLPRYGVFVYSDLCFGKESGDASGYRIKLTRSTKGESLYLEWSEGPLYGPALATDLVINSKTSEIIFTIPAHTEPNDLPESEHYQGRISTTDISLNGDLVPRVKSAKGRIGMCK